MSERNSDDAVARLREWAAVSGALEPPPVETVELPAADLRAILARLDAAEGRLADLEPVARAAVALYNDGYGVAANLPVAGCALVRVAAIEPLTASVAALPPATRAALVAPEEGT